MGPRNGERDGRLFHFVDRYDQTSTPDLFVVRALILVRAHGLALVLMWVMFFAW